jgi:hypothetical protein
MSHYYGYSDETTLAITEGVQPALAEQPQPLTWTRPQIDPKYAAMNLSPYLPGLARILQ